MAILTRFKKYIQRKLGISQLFFEHQRMEDEQKLLLACQQENLKANLFRDTICDSVWLKYKSFSPGGWAVDYGLLYTLYRVLNDMKPHNVIEFGLGQSSKLIHQYGTCHKDASVLTCEHNKEWAYFFEADVNGKYAMNIKFLNLDTRIYQGFETCIYTGLDEIRKGQKYDLIVIDGPYGTDHFSRPQLIDLVQDNLSDRFCVIMDDYDREGERETVEEVKKVLDMKHVPYLCRVYEASKQHCLICSKDLQFLTTLCWF